MTKKYPTLKLCSIFYTNIHNRYLFRMHKYTRTYVIHKPGSQVRISYNQQIYRFVRQKILVRIMQRENSGTGTCVGRYNYTSTLTTRYLVNLVNVYTRKHSSYGVVFIIKIKKPRNAERDISTLQIISIYRLETKLLGQQNPRNKEQTLCRVIVGKILLVPFITVVVAGLKVFLLITAGLLQG